MKALITDLFSLIKNGLGELKPYKELFVFSFFLYIVSFIFGYFIRIPFSSCLNGFLAPLFTISNNPTSFLFILYNNFFVTLFIIITGFLSLGVVPLFILIYEGWKTGFVLFLITTSKEVFPLKVLLAGILPHGILEIPAFLLAVSVGTYYGLNSAKTLYLEKKFTIEQFIFSLKIFNNFIAPLILIAAFIETVFTPIIIKNLLW